MNLEVMIGTKKLAGSTARAECEAAIDSAGGQDLDAWWWREGREGPWCIYVSLPPTGTKRRRSMTLAHSSWSQLKKDLKLLGLESTIRRVEVSTV
ncbi:MAG: hypothetical protein ACT4PO_06180 [Actinomycetota bacterium]